MSSHRKTLHGEVASTIAAVRSLFWILVLTKLTKSVIQNYYDCNALKQRFTQILTRVLTERQVNVPTIQANCIISLKIKKVSYITYILLFSCSVNRAVPLELVSSLTTTEFIKSFKRLISRRGKPNIIYSDNAKTFKAGAKWLNGINRDKKFHDFLSKERIIWKFNLSKAKLLGGQYERLLRLTKQSLYKSIVKSLLTWSDLEEVLSDIEVNLNNQPLTHIEEDLEYSVLTLNSMILRRDIKLPDDSPEEEEVSANLKKRQRYVGKCKKASWKRWVHEYLTALRERHNLSHKEKPVKININNVVKLKGDEKNGGK